MQNKKKTRHWYWKDDKEILVKTPPKNENWQLGRNPKLHLGQRKGFKHTETTKQRIGEQFYSLWQDPTYRNKMLKHRPSSWENKTEEEYKQHCEKISQSMKLTGTLRVLQSDTTQLQKCHKVPDLRLCIEH